MSVFPLQQTTLNYCENALDTDDKLNPKLNQLFGSSEAIKTVGLYLKPGLHW